MKKVFFLLFISIFTTLSFCKAQNEYQPGYVILTDGTRIAGLIRLNNDEPWFNQRRIWMKDSAAVAADPNVKAKKYKVDDLKFFQVGNRMFDKVHHVDTENLQLKSFGTNDHMMERLAMGKITAHRYYSYPQDFVVYAKSEEEVEEIEAEKKHDLLIGYKIFVQKDNDTKLHDAFDYDMQKLFGDTPDVAQKYQDGGYGNHPIVTKKGIGARLISMAKKTTFKEEDAQGIIAAINDYNEKNAGK